MPDFTENKAPLPYKAAQFSFWIPFVSMLISLAASSDVIANYPTVKSLIVYCYSLAILAGFLAGIYALISIRKYGKAGLLADGLLGLLINGTFLLAIFFICVHVASP